MAFHQPITPIMGPTIGFPCIWHQIKSQDKGIRTATFTNWDWLAYLTDGDLPSALDLDFRCNDHTCDEQLALAAAEYINVTMRSAESSYTFVYFGNVDVAGHHNGHCGEEYLKAIDEADRFVGLLMDVVDRAEKFGPDSDGEPTTVAVLLSTDHGGHGNEHGAQQDSDIVIPAFVRGPRSIGNGGKYVEFHHEVRNVDYAPTTTEWLGVQQSPWWSGRVLEEAIYRHSARENVRCDRPHVGHRGTPTPPWVELSRGISVTATTAVHLVALFIHRYVVAIHD